MAPPLLAWDRRLRFAEGERTRNSQRVTPGNHRRLHFAGAQTTRLLELGTCSRRRAIGSQDLRAVTMMTAIDQHFLQEDEEVVDHDPAGAAVHLEAGRQFRLEEQITVAVAAGRSSVAG